MVTSLRWDRDSILGCSYWSSPYICNRKVWVVLPDTNKNTESVWKFEESWRDVRKQSRQSPASIQLATPSPPAVTSQPVPTSQPNLSESLSWPSINLHPQIPPCSTRTKEYWNQWTRCQSSIAGPSWSHNQQDYWTRGHNHRSCTGETGEWETFLHFDLQMGFWWCIRPQWIQTEVQFPWHFWLEYILHYSCP